MLKSVRSFVLFVIVPLGTVVSLGGATKATSPVADSARLTAWMKSNAHPFATCIPGDSVKDLASLKQIVGDARIVALGEGTHGTREFFQLKHRIVQYLATEMGFNVFAIEANLPEAWRINDYVLGGPGDPKELMCGMRFWTWNTEEVLQMIEWMRRFNASGKGRIEFTGFDMQSPDSAAAIVNRYLKANDPAWADTVNALVRVSPQSPEFVTSTGTLPVADFAGHHVRYSGFIRTQDVTNFAGLWMRADVAGKSPAFDNMQNQQVSGTKDWNRYAIELDIPKETHNINFGVLMAGEGQAWFDSLAVEVDGKLWHNDAFDLTLESPDGPKGLTGYPSYGYVVAMDDHIAARGTRSLSLSGYPAAAPGAPFVTATGKLPAKEFAGHKIHYSGSMRTQDVSGFAGLWMRADAGANSGVAFDNMRAQHVRRTKDWARYSIDLTIPQEADTIHFGVLMTGSGRAWFDDLAIEIDGRPWQNAGIDLKLEDAGGPRGLSRKPYYSGFTIAMDDSVAANGKWSLRLAGSPPPAVGIPTAHRLLDHLEASRARMGTSAQADWVVRNAHVLLQRTQMALGNRGAVRDSSMAANLEWIADQARPNSRIVIWAHNGHVNKHSPSMGDWLAKRYGKDFVAVGFMANEGTYTAVKQGGGGLSSDFSLQAGPPGSIEAISNATGLPRFFIDLRQARKTPPVDQALKSQLLMRSIGAMGTDQQFFPTAVSQYFDALAWVGNTEASQCFGFCP
jgi:erythromycin esterase-like protein